MIQREGKLFLDQNLRVFAMRAYRHDGIEDHVDDMNEAIDNFEEVFRLRGGAGDGHGGRTQRHDDADAQSVSTGMSYGGGQPVSAS